MPRSGLPLCDKGEEKPLILTARLDEEAQNYFNDLRQRHFPAERNYLAAHLTLFHALPGAEMDKIHLKLSDTASEQPVICGQVTGLRSLGRGVAFTVECARLQELRATLSQSWGSFLTPQDRQSWRPHITVQNKVEPAAARELLKQLSVDHEPMPIRFPGLDLFFYEGGPWGMAHSYSFGS